MEKIHPPIGGIPMLVIALDPRGLLVPAAFAAITFPSQSASATGCGSGHIDERQEPLASNSTEMLHLVQTSALQASAPLPNRQL
ncbi:hypothetical protein BV22DRAFT_495468 [Leucogyrophana mollusca]|uniref:Uncharacterized protein n=1 Tax=Leucogyrophana mollusca TaxID=85980 RepID=A0ACB8BFI7_9AGAM|nr:hypothetical protein BV22DRAFT_495468 [Leucogyrophana mollusca]